MHGVTMAWAWHTVVSFAWELSLRFSSSFRLKSFMLCKTSSQGDPLPLAREKGTLCPLA